MHVIIHRSSNNITPAQQITIQSTKQRQHYPSVHLLRYKLLSSPYSPSFQPTHLRNISLLPLCILHIYFPYITPTTIIIIRLALSISNILDLIRSTIPTYLPSIILTLNTYPYLPLSPALTATNAHKCHYISNLCLNGDNEPVTYRLKHGIPPTDDDTPSHAYHIVPSYLKYNTLTHRSEPRYMLCW